MPSTQNGGVWALGGYLYQTIGILGIGALISTGEQSAPTTQGNLDLIIRLVNVREASEITPEAFNEDALVQTCLDIEDEGVFVQFKYSAQISPPPIGPEEVRKIVSTFDSSVAQVAEAGIRITACVLITNRAFVAGQDSGGQRWQHEKDHPQRRYKLKEIVGINSQSFYDALHKFAQRYGATETEIEDGINSLIGQVMRQSAGEVVNPSSFKKRLVKAFTGHADAQPISARDLQSVCQGEKDRYAQNLRINDWRHDPVERRQAYRKIFDLVQTRALIGLYGPGGCGKSVLLWQLLRDQLKPVCTIYRASQLYTNWLPQQINHVYRRMPPDQSNESIEQAVQRLVTANGNLPKPVLWLGLDGLDEVTDSNQRQVMREIATWFWERDKRGGNFEAVMITTYRSRDQLIDLLDLPNDYSDPELATVALGEFNDEEVGDALTRTGHTQFVKTLEGFPGRNAYPPGRGYATSALSRIAPSIRSSLYHPVIWRSLLPLPTVTQEAVFQGKQEALDQLASGYIKWFSDKVSRKRILDLNEEGLRELLCEIARRTPRDTSCPKSAWLTPTTDYCGSQNMANNFFGEAERTGLVQSESLYTWHWKHTFVYDFLKRQFAATSTPHMATRASSGGILIVTVTKTEAQSVRKVFCQDIGQDWIPYRIGNKTYYDLGTQGKASVYMVQSEMGTATPGGALVTVYHAIQDLQPQAIIMCGIAFGLRPGNQVLGDILVSRQLRSYEPQKVDVELGYLWRGDRVTASDRLLDRFRSADHNWHGPQSHFGLLLSGEKLVNDPSFRDLLLKAEPEAIGGEMEGAGLYVAARDAEVDWIIVKAICDWADGTKTDDIQERAALNAAEFVLHVLKSGGLDEPKFTSHPSGTI